MSSVNKISSEINVQTIEHQKKRYGQISKKLFFNSVKHKEKQNTTQTVAELDPMHATV